MSKKDYDYWGNSYWQSEEWNKRKTYAYITQIEALALNRFKWEGLPSTVDTRYLEWCLLHDGIATIAHPLDLPGIWVSGKAATEGPINRYNRPTRWRCYGATGDSFEVTPLNGVIIYDNQTRANPWNQLDLWARELADIDRTRDINRAHIKNPIIFSGPRGKKTDVENILKAWLGGEPAIMLYDGLEANGISIEELKFEVPFYGAELFADAMNVLNRLYTFLGIENLPTKAERMIQEEIQSTQEPTSIMALNCLNSRNDCIKGVHSMGLEDAKCYWHYGKYEEIPNYGRGEDGIPIAGIPQEG